MLRFNSRKPLSSVFFFFTILFYFLTSCELAGVCLCTRVCVYSWQGNTQSNHCRAIDTGGERCPLQIKGVLITETITSI